MFQLFNGLKTSKATGLDIIQAKILNLAAPPKSDSLTYLFNLSLTTEKVPSEKCFHQQLYSFIVENNILCSDQSGFRNIVQLSPAWITLLRISAILQIEVARLDLLRGI